MYNNGNFMMFDNKNDRKLQSKSRVIHTFYGIAFASLLSACSGLGVDHSVCDLRVLSLQIPKQSAEALTGSEQAINELKKTQEKLKMVLPSAVKHLKDQSDVEILHEDAEAIYGNIARIVQNQKNLNHIYDYTLAVAETVPGIQAEYNLMVNMMTRENYPSTQVLIAKNQVFIAERMLRSLSGITNSNEFQVNNIEDFSADLETFNIYLKAQLNGNLELGVTRVNNPQLRLSLEAIKRDVDEILIAGSRNLNQNAEQIVRVSYAVKDNQAKSAEIFNKLEKIE